MKLKHISILCMIGLSAGLTAQSIILPDQPALTEKTAAEELSEHLEKMLGKPIPVTSESKPGAAPRIYVGNTAFAGKKNFEPEAWQIKAKGKDALILQGGLPRGILYAAWEFLEQNGILWMDEESTYIPKKKELVWEKDLDLSGKPAFRIRGVYSYNKGGYPQRIPNNIFYARNKYNLYNEPPNETMNKYGITRTTGSPDSCHTYIFYSEDWKGEDAECFAMNKEGKRVPPNKAQTHGQICFTNPRTLQLITEKLRKYIKEDRAKGIYAEMYDISQNDNSEECYCPPCHAAIKKYGSFGGLILEFTNKIAENMEKDYPEIKIRTFAYHTSAKVPSNIRGHKNVIVQIALMGAEFLGVQTRDIARPLTHPNNKKDMETFIGWSKIANIAIWDYWLIWKSGGITLFNKTIAENIRFYKSIGAVDVFAECEFPMENLFHSMRLWMGARLCNNPDIDLDKEINRYLNAYYGEKAAPYMRQIYDYVQKRNDSIPYSLSRLGRNARPDMDQEFFRHTGNLIEKALAVAETEEHKKHIRKERFTLDRENLLKFLGKAHPDMKTFKKRIYEDFDLTKDTFNNTRTQAALKEELDLHCLAMDVVIKPPVGFEDYEIMHDITWPILKKSGSGVDLVDMPDAAAGKALRKADTKEHTGVAFGLYDNEKNQHIHRVTIAPKYVAQDEKFHYYSLGVVTLRPQCSFWAHPTWWLGCKLDAYYSRERFIDNECEIFVSLKAEGPNYVKGSTKPNTLSMDRILIVRPKKDKKK